MCAATKNKIINKNSLFNYQHELNNGIFHTKKKRIPMSDITSITFFFY